MAENRDSGSLGWAITAFVLGSLFGAALAVFLTPATGTETREKVREVVDKTREALEKKREELKRREEELPSDEEIQGEV